MKGLRLITQVVLLLVAIFLTYMLYSSIMEPVRYEKAKNDKKKIIIEKLMHIKDLQIEFKAQTGRYSGSFDTLKDFYLHGKMPVVLKIGTNDTLTEEKALALGLISRDTSYIFVKDTLFKDVKDFNIDRIDIVPGTEGKVKFNLQAGRISRANFLVPVFEVSCLMKDYLITVEEQHLLLNEINILEGDSKFPGLKLGSMEEPSTDGNWQ
jgi:hypothetical protein